MPPDPFLHLPEDDRREALLFATSQTGRPTNLLEKDVWVVQSLEILFSSQYGSHLVFKGGTALSKVHGVIDRFSEDIDVTYDICELVPEARKFMHDVDVVPDSRSQQDKLTAAIRKERLPKWVQTEVLPLFSSALSSIPGVKLHAVDSPGSPGVDSLIVEYASVTPASTYALPRVTLEFGGRSTGEPATPSHIVCDIAQFFSDLTFPTAEPRAMDLSRIFWEKATAIHVYCLKRDGKIGHRFSRHFYDLAQLHNRGLVEVAAANKRVAIAVAEHKSMFFREKTAAHTVIDYHGAVNGALTLVPEGNALDALREDYLAMISEGLLFADALSFDVIIGHCEAIQKQANQVHR
jgi:hypothetical protein